MGLGAAKTGRGQQPHWGKQQKTLALMVEHRAVFCLSGCIPDWRLIFPLRLRGCQIGESKKALGSGGNWRVLTVVAEQAAPLLDLSLLNFSLMREAREDRGKAEVRIHKALLCYGVAGPNYPGD